MSKNEWIDFCGLDPDLKHEVRMLNNSDPLSKHAVCIPNDSVCNEEKGGIANRLDYTSE